MFVVVSGIPVTFRAGSEAFGRSGFHEMGFYFRNSVKASKQTATPHTGSLKN